uniref:Ig-like domain-containing protein n=1 Tax=Aeromonas enteropelogenes TaxID=29489 RepID=UPI003BA18D23
VGAGVGATTVTATKDGVTSNTVEVTVTAAVITAIQVTPSLVNVPKGTSQQLTALATYSDNTSSDITSSVTWAPNDTGTATVTANGLLVGAGVGATTVTATKDGVTSNTVEVTVCDLAALCLDVVKINNKLFTNSPSVVYLNSIGGSATDGIQTETGTYGPSGDFYRFSWANANALCTTYNAKSIGGRTNWRLATEHELEVELFNKIGNMFAARGWPTFQLYWIARDSALYMNVSLNSGIILSQNPSHPNYVSCVSEL